jgi:hypothetical protein
MGSGHLFLVLCIAVFGGAVGLFGPMLGVPWTVAKAIAAVALGGAYLYLVRHGRHARAAKGAREPHVSPYEVRFDGTEVVVTRNDKLDERVAWDDLVTVGLRIDDAFPPQPWWMLLGRASKGAHYPSAARGAREMLHELQRRLAGFDDEAVIEAMGMLAGDVVVWERASTPGQPS